VSTNTFARFSWSLPGTGGGSSKAFNLTSSAGSCVVARDVESGCTIASLGVGQSVTIQFSGTTSTSFIGSHTMSVGATNDEGANVSANGIVSTKKSILCIGDCDDSSSGGGGAGGIPMLAVLLLFALGRRRQIGSSDG
jgi:MYXO-CTERM domain-containing protein